MNEFELILAILKALELRVSTLESRSDGSEATTLALIERLEVVIPKNPLIARLLGL